MLCCGVSGTEALGLDSLARRWAAPTKKYLALGPIAYVVRVAGSLFLALARPRWCKRCAAVSLSAHEGGGMAACEKSLSRIVQFSRPTASGWCPDVHSGPIEL